MQEATVVVDDDEDFAISFWHNESGSIGDRHGHHNHLTNFLQSELCKEERIGKTSPLRERHIDQPNNPINIKI